MTLATLARMIGIKGGIIIALLLALGFVSWRADAISGQRDKAIQRAANEAAAHAVTKASLANLEQRLAAMIAAGEQRTRAAQDALREQQGRSEALGEQIARIRAEKPGTTGACVTPRAVLAAKGL